MEQELADLTQTLIEIYKKNLIYLEQNHEKLFEEVEKLSKDINCEKYHSKYSLEYKEGYFDILNLENNTWFYNANSYDDADSRSSHANFTKDGSLDLLRKDLDGDTLLGGSDIDDIMPLINYINENVDLKNIEFDKIYKYVFVGSGLGIHIHEIFKKLNPMTTLIIEPNLEIFRLSLFIIDYNEFDEGNKKLFLSVGESRLERMKTLENFYLHHNYMNYNIKHHLLIENDRYLYDELVDFFSTNTVTAFPYTKTIENVFKTVAFKQEKYKFLNQVEMSEKEVLKEKDVLLVAAGPSLDNYIEWIKEHQDRFIIICVDVILRKLEKNGIVPDIVVSIDPSHMCAEYLKCDDKEFLKNSAYVFLSQQHDDVKDVVIKENVFIAQSIPLISEIGYLGSVPNVGAYSFIVAIHLGAKSIFAIGTDAAFNQETGNRYANDSSWDQMESLDFENKNGDFISDYDVVEMKGNLRDKVKTNRSLLAFKDSFELVSHDHKEYFDVEIYNLSDGAYIEGFTPYTKDDINKYIGQKEKNEKNILKLLEEVSLEVENIDFSSDTKKIINMINKVKKHKKVKVLSRNHFLDEKLKMMIWTLEESKKLKIPIFGNIFLMYTELMDIYLNFILNLKQNIELDNDELEKLNGIWSDGLINILGDFKKIVEGKIK